MPSTALEVRFACLWGSHQWTVIQNSFVEIYQVFLQLRKHLGGQAVQHTNTHFVNTNTSFFMYVQFAFLHILTERMKMQSTRGMMEPEVGSTKYLGGYLLD